MRFIESSNLKRLQGIQIGKSKFAHCDFTYRMTSQTIAKIIVPKISKANPTKIVRKKPAKNMPQGL